MIQIKYGSTTPPFSDELVSPIVIEEVYFPVPHMQMEIVTIRIREEVNEGYRAVLEILYPCSECNADNWIVAGTDPGDYRCIVCTAWL